MNDQYMPEPLDELRADKARDRDLAYAAACRYAEAGSLGGIETELLDALACACAFELQDREHRDAVKHPELF